MDASPGPLILMTTDTVGGVWSYAVELVRALDQRGVRVVLATMGAPLRAHQRSQLAGLRLAVLRESAYKLEWMEGAWDDVDRAGEWLLALEREQRPDLVHLNQFAFGALPFAAPTLVVAHSCVLSWWRAVHGGPAPPAWEQYRRRVERGLDRAGLVAAPTRAMLRTLARNYGYARDGLVIGNGRSPALFKPGPKQPFVLAAGRLWDEGKNLAALQAVAPRLPWPLRLAGPARSPGHGSAAAVGAGHLGELTAEQLSRQLSAAAIYALPARYEPFGLSVLEAALCQCALVLGDIDSLQEIWGPAALYVAPDDHVALERALRRLIEHPAERDRLALAARTRALHFGSQRMVKAYLAAYALLQPRLAPRWFEEMQCT